MSNSAFLLTTIVIPIAVVLLFVYRKQAGRKKVSKLGQYQGYSEASYDGYERRSLYLTLGDGTRLAYDLLLPSVDGVPADQPLPALFKYTPYLRAFTIFDPEGNFHLGELYELSWFQKTMLRMRHRISDEGHLMDAVVSARWL